MKVCPRQPHAQPSVCAVKTPQPSLLRKQKCLPIATAKLALHASVGEVFPVSFGRPAPSDFDSQDNQTGPTPRTYQLWITAFLSSSSSLKNHTVPVGCTVMRGAITVHRAHRSGVDGQQTTPEQGKPVHNHFQTAAVGGQLRKVHVSHQTIRPNTSSCLPANVSCSTFESEPPSAQHSRLCARSTVVAKRIDWTATPATKQGRRQRQAEAPQEDDPEKMRRDLRQTT